MSAAFHVHPAYLDAPWVAHVPRREFLLRMCPSCWEDACHLCWRADQDTRCICACNDEPPARPLHVRPAPRPRRCRTCGYLIRTEAHKMMCGTVSERLMRLASPVGAAS